VSTIQKRRVVITGMGAVTPCGNDIRSTWENLVAGKAGIGRITKFDVTDFPVKIAGEVKNFDPALYLDKKELRRLDPVVHYAVAAADMALADSKLDLAHEDKDMVGAVIGSGVGGIIEFQEQHARFIEKGPLKISPFFIPKLMANASAGQLAIKYGIRGVNYCTVSACSSSAHALGAAMRSIQLGEADVMFAGGSEAAMSSLGIAGFQVMTALSNRNDEPERASRPFDRDRDGFVMGEGAGVVILEEMEHAKKRGARIYAEMVGVGMSADGYHITSPDPDGVGACLCMTRAVKDAGRGFEEVGYINAHGTSTQYNDLVETRAIKKVFGDYAQKIPISSSKSMIGHLLGAGGAVEAMVTALSIHEGRIHPTLNFENPGEECTLDYVPEGARKADINLAISNSFGFGGHNVCLAIAKYKG
jgi:3-oxoacyl-[acyl-carrier-protein] synthase II